MKNIYLAVSDRLKAEVPELRHIDLQKGQMNYSRPPIAFPAGLVTIVLPKTENLNAKRQLCNALVIVDLCFDFTGYTDRNTPDEVLNDTLSYLDVKQKVYTKLQGFGNTEMNPLERVNESEPPRPDAYKVTSIAFTTSYRDYTADV